MKPLFACMSPLLVAACFCAPALAQDPAKVGPDIYKCNFENERVRVCEVTFKPGARMGAHSHPDHVVYALTAGKIEITKDGKPQVVDITPGQVLYMPAETHSGANVGTTEIKLVITELKPPMAGTKPSGTR
jgi:quercetin dioxygenase-like cupin family protein